MMTPLSDEALASRIYFDDDGSGKTSVRRITQILAEHRMSLAAECADRAVAFYDLGFSPGQEADLRAAIMDGTPLPADPRDAEIARLRGELGRIANQDLFETHISARHMRSIARAALDAKGGM